MAICENCGEIILSRLKICPGCGKETGLTEDDIFVNKYNFDSRREFELHIKHGRTFHFKGKKRFGGKKKQLIISPEQIQWIGGLKVRKKYNMIKFKDIKEIEYMGGGSGVFTLPLRGEELYDRGAVGSYDVRILLKNEHVASNFSSKWEDTKNILAHLIMMNALDIYLERSQKF